jgi:ribonuclease VapC
MVIDTSALIAIALGEPSRERLLDALETAADRVLSAMSLLEAGMVLRARLGESAVGLLYQLVDELVSEVAVFDESQARLATAAFGRFEKEWGTGHSSTSGIVPYTRWRYPAVSRCWQLVMFSQRRTCPAIGCSGPLFSVNRSHRDRRFTGGFRDGRVGQTIGSRGRPSPLQRVLVT